MVELDQEEREILDAYARGELESIALSREEMRRYREAARAVGGKDMRINIRISARDVEDLKIKAMEEGLPYQTLIATVLHRYATDQLVTKR